jgi:hypothetical protein
MRTLEHTYIPRKTEKEQKHGETLLTDSAPSFQEYATRRIKKKKLKKS